MKKNYKRNEVLKIKNAVGNYRTEVYNLLTEIHKTGFDLFKCKSWGAADNAGHYLDDIIKGLKNNKECGCVMYTESK